ncbi:albusnodin family lasso peptide [Pseudonocardia nantongensis]
MSSETELVELGDAAALTEGGGSGTSEDKRYIYS